VSGDEALSPRGRIALMRAVDSGDTPLTPEIDRSMETCVMCRGCEPACPSGVHFGHLMEKTRDHLAEEHRITPRWARAGLALVGHPRLLRGASLALAVAQRARVVPSRSGLPLIPLRQQPLVSTGDDVHLFTGCVMDAWQRSIHMDTKKVLEAAGYGVQPTGDAVPCCGALHAHAGLSRQARRLAERAVDELSDGHPVLVNSAGCGAALKDVGRLLGTRRAEELAARVFDISEWLAQRLERLPRVPPLDMRVAVQDPCHLRHVQRVHAATRAVLAPFVGELVELDDEGLCCGAGGMYSLLEPRLAGDIRQRKVDSISRSRPDLVASANPGCAMHLAGAGVRTVHPMTVVAQALDGGRSGGAG
jgi:glycolate oxidase iron-sulfur subunit